jgi:aldehyde oxidoreductase
MLKKKLIVNGNERLVIADPETPLSTILRNQLHLLGTKVGCGKGECGTCSIILDDKVTRACITRFIKVPDEAQIITIEGVGTKENLHPVQLSWMVHGAAQCGFCTPGFIVSAKALLDQNPNPKEKMYETGSKKTEMSADAQDINK